ncbi:ParB/RepB/Spo0J family partition protein [Nitrosophilus alvini]|uniref:ParB/RepB/Spo0J family partition protein n=1 Tax=Nitrosophilus alvini TaxID=2714855 RepID=UPI00190B615E|nr:ParB/RepB/Spo0J family partition protein [Nitrosophilus alvini]
MSRKTLGRGLGAILSEVAEAYEKEIPDSDENSVVEIDIDAIRPNPFQPRRVFDEKSLNELAESIKRHGLLQPVIVIEDIDGFMLIAGERRVRASRLAGLDKIKAIVAKIEPSKYRELALIENIQREDLNPVDLALSYKELIDEYSITHEELSNIVKKSRTHITNTLRLLMLSDYAKEALKAGKITPGHAKVLVGLEEDKQKIIVDSITGQKLSVRDVEKLVNKTKPKKEKQKSKNREDLNMEEIEKTLKDSNLNFKIHGNKLTIKFDNNEEIRYFLKKYLRKSY